MWPQVKVVRTGESACVGVGREMGGGVMLEPKLAWNSGQSSCFILPGPRVADVSHHAQSFWNLCPGIQTLNFERRRRDQMAWGGGRCTRDRERAGPGVTHRLSRGPARAAAAAGPVAAVVATRREGCVDSWSSGADSAPSWSTRTANVETPGSHLAALEAESVCQNRCRLKNERESGWKNFCAQAQ